MIGNVDAYQYRDSEIGQQGGYGNGIKDNRVSAYPIRKKTWSSEWIWSILTHESLYFGPRLFMPSIFGFIGLDCHLSLLLF